MADCKFISAAALATSIGALGLSISFFSGFSRPPVVESSWAQCVLRRLGETHSNLAVHYLVEACNRIAPDIKSPSVVAWEQEQAAAKAKDAQAARQENPFIRAWQAERANRNPLLDGPDRDHAGQDTHSADGVRPAIRLQPAGSQTGQVFGGTAPVPTNRAGR
jgi:hypothetical protein